MINILIEGPDGVGKSTLATNLARKLDSEKGNSFQTVSVHEPNNFIDRDFRKIFLTPESVSAARVDNHTELQIDREVGAISPKASCALAIASLLQTDKVIELAEKEANRDGRELIVIHDRGIVSTMVYQGIQHDIPPHQILSALCELESLTTFDAVLMLSGLETDDQSEDIHTTFGHSELARSGYRHIFQILGMFPLSEDAPEWARKIRCHVSEEDKVNAHCLFSEVTRINTGVSGEEETLNEAYEYVNNIVIKRSLTRA